MELIKSNQIKSNQLKPVETVQKLRRFYAAIFCVALFFWCWALKNTLEMVIKYLDLGVISFGSVLLTSSYLYGALSAANGFGNIPLWTKTLATASHVLVAINYLGGAYLAVFIFETTHLLVAPYCVTFTFVWLAIAYFGNQFMNELNAEETRPLNR
jgi:hypothetical protein